MAQMPWAVAHQQEGSSEIVQRLGGEEEGGEDAGDLVVEVAVVAAAGDDGPMVVVVGLERASMEGQDTFGLRPCPEKFERGLPAMTGLATHLMTNCRKVIGRRRPLEMKGKHEKCVAAMPQGGFMCVR